MAFVGKKKHKRDLLSVVLFFSELPMDRMILSRVFIRACECGVFMCAITSTSLIDNDVFFSLFSSFVSTVRRVFFMKISFRVEKFP